MTLSDSSFLSSVQWETIAATTVVSTFLVSVLTYLFRPLADKLWIKVLERNKAEIKSILNNWYNVKDEGQKLVKIEQEVHTLTQDISEIKEAIESGVEKIETASRQIAHIYGQMRQEPWDGQTERRQGR